MKPPFYRFPPPPPQGRWGRIRPPPPRDRYEHPLPQQTGTSNPFPQKDAECACATSVDAGGASDPLSPRDRYEQPLPPTPPPI